MICDLGHETVTEKDEDGNINLTVINHESGEVLYKLQITKPFDVHDIQDRLEDGECPICNEWEYLAE